MPDQWTGKLKKDWMEVWDPYLVDGPDDAGNWDCHCPVHRDRNPSASVNFENGLWYCYACGDGGPIEVIWVMLTERHRNGWVPPWVSGVSGGKKRVIRRKKKGYVEALPSERMIERWHYDLMSDEHALEYLIQIRGLSLREIERRRLIRKQAMSGVNYGIPVYDERGELKNVRYYSPPTPISPKKIWSTPGHGSPARLYPLDVLDGNKHICIVEGEFDALVLNSRGIPAITGTGGGGKRKWKEEWSDYFEGKIVYIIPDRDRPGMDFAIEAKDFISEFAESVSIVALPYDIKEDNGEDVSDYLVRDAVTTAEFRSLLQRSRRVAVEEELMADGQVDSQIRAIQVRSKAQEEFRRIQLELNWKEPPSTLTVADEMEEPLPPVDYTIKELHPTGGNALLRAGYKVGKSTILLNLMRSLVDGEPFLGRFPVESPRGNVAFWNYEVSRSQFREWLKAVGLKNQDNASVLNLRGEVLPLDVKEMYEWAVNWVRNRNVSCLIVDPFSRAYSGDENDNSAVGAWLDNLDEFKKDAGIDDLFLSAHFGRDQHQERARGAARLEDWPDALWLLTQQDGERYFSAIGRDVDVPEAKLYFEQDTKSLSIIGGSRKDERRNKIIDEMVMVLGSVDEELTPNQLAESVSIGSRADKAEALSIAEKSQLVTVELSGKKRVCKLP